MCFVLVLVLGSCATAAGQGQDELGRSAASRKPAPDVHSGSSGSAREDSAVEFGLPDFQAALRQLGQIVGQGAAWYGRTPPGERMCWGGLLASALLALAVVLERLSRLRRRSIIPAEFTARFLDRLHEGKLDGGKALDYCEMNPSPAARIALAAVRRWGRPAADLERAVALAHRAEAEQLRRNVGTLKRVAVLAPLLGLLGMLLAAGRVLAAVPPTGLLAEKAAVAAGSTSWPAELASTLVPLTSGVALATLALVAYDVLVTRIERLAGALDRLGAETIDAIAVAVPPPPLSTSTSVAGSRVVEAHQGHAPGIQPPMSANHARPGGGRRTSEGGRTGVAKDHGLGF
jgi:biopolymer transport protein ExbB